MGRVKSEVGEIGEDVACKYLIDRGCRIIDRNVRERWGEIDVIAKDRNGVVLFVEVKTFVGNKESFSPEQNYSANKAFKTRRVVHGFVNSHPGLINEDQGFQIDLVAINIANPQLTDWKKDCEIRHYENV